MTLVTYVPDYSDFFFRFIREPQWESCTFATEKKGYPALPLPSLKEGAKIALSTTYTASLQARAL